MDYQLGSKDPKREINLGRFGSWVFVIIFLGAMISLAYFLATTYLLEGNEDITYVKCNDGGVEKLEKGKYTYCGEYVGGDTIESIKEYVKNVHSQKSIGTNPFIQYNE